MWNAKLGHVKNRFTHPKVSEICDETHLEKKMTHLPTLTVVEYFTLLVCHVNDYYDEFCGLLCFGN